MNEDILKGKWKQVRGEIQNWWGRLTHDDLDRIEGNTEKLAGILQERYGITRNEAQHEVANFLDQIENQLERQNNQ